jgi:hypothetical protein
MIRPLDEILTFIASGHTTEEVAQYEATPEAKAIVADLIHKEKTIGLTTAETSQLNSYMQLEHIMRLAKARARILATQK